MGGGDPLLHYSFDDLVFYPKCVDPFVPYCKNIHPNWITLLNIFVKWFALMSVLEWNPWGLLVWGTLERWLDCLDGRVARRFNKTSFIGHWMDKVSDLIYRWSSAGIAVWLSVPLLKQDLVAPGALISVCIACPALYVYDGYHGRIVDGNTTRESIAIYLEDNATLLCLLFPLMQWYILSRCVVVV